MDQFAAFVPYSTIEGHLSHSIKSLSPLLKLALDGDSPEQLMSRDWLRHSTVDRRTLRPLSMAHLSPCQQPCRPTRTPSSVQQTCNNGEGKEKKNITTELQMDTQQEMDYKVGI